MGDIRSLIDPALLGVGVGAISLSVGTQGRVNGCGLVSSPVGVKE